MFPRTVVEYVYPSAFKTRRVNNSGDISWHRDRVFVSEVFRFEDLGFELVAEGFYKVCSSAISKSESSMLRVYVSGLCRCDDELGQGRREGCSDKPTVEGHSRLILLGSRAPSRSK
jgi:hypothetical protein